MNNQLNHAVEKEFLNSLVSDYRDVSPYSQIKKDIIFELISKAIKVDNSVRALQMGCSNGYETEQLSRLFQKLDVIDGSSVFIERLKTENKFNNIRYIYSLFEEFDVEDVSLKYDFVFCNYVLEHVFDSVAVLKQIKKILKPGGSLIVVVPNANALSRRIAQQMNLVKDLEELTENDLRHGHRRVYDLEKIKSEFQQAGYKIATITGIVFKILADFQLNKLLNEGFLTRDHIIAMQRLAEMPENVGYSDSFYLVANQDK